MTTTDDRTNDRPPTDLYTALLDLAIAVHELAGDDAALCADAFRLPERRADGSWAFGVGDWHFPRAAHVLTAMRALRWIADRYDDQRVSTFIGDIEDGTHAAWDARTAALTRAAKPA